jgi:hypothetical protein
MGENETPNETSEPPSAESAEANQFIESAKLDLNEAEAGAVLRHAAAIVPESVSEHEDPTPKLRHWQGLVKKLETDYQTALIAKKLGQPLSSLASPRQILSSLTSAVRNMEACERALSRYHGWRAWRDQMDAAEATFNAAPKTSATEAKQALLTLYEAKEKLGCISGPERLAAASIKTELGA